MRPDDLKRRLGAILTKEERGPDVDWEAVIALSDSLKSELPQSVPAIVQAYLDGANERRSDSDFAHAQRSELVRFLRDS